MRGNDIQVLQVLLNMLPDDIIPTNLKVDGIFGPASRSAVKELQKYFRLRADGAAGPDTFFILGHRTGKYAQGEPVFSSRILKNESVGGDVLVLQNRLASFKKTYLNRTPSENYDLPTEEAVRRFQDDFPALNPDGITGPLTYDQILIQSPLGGRNLRRGRNGLDTYFLQFYLYQLKYYTRALNGYFDAYTEKALLLFQKDAQIKADGVLGPQTFLALGSSIAFPQNEYRYRVVRGDSIFKIAALFNRNMEEIIKLNNIEPPDYRITAGQLLQIPLPLTYHLAQKGNTLADLSRKYAVSENDIKQANDLLPDSFIVPGEMIVLPRYQEGMSGNIVYLNQEKSKTQLKTITLPSLKMSVLTTFDNLVYKSIFPNKDSKKLSVLVSNGNQLINYDLETNIEKSLTLPAVANYLDWSYDAKKIVVDEGVIIDAQNGQTLFTFQGSLPQWMRDNKTLIYYINNTIFKKINMDSGIQQEVFSLPEDFIWFFKLDNDNSNLLVLAFVPPGRVTISRVYDLLSKQLSEISRNDYFGEWSRDSQALLLKARDYYGDFFPWFYQNIRLLTAAGALIEDELYAKGVELNAGIFAPDDSSFLSVMFNPSTFYPVPQRSRDLYIKKLNSRLITQITAAEMAYSPVWTLS
ncbi:MAG: peptidoglycan-binding protein [Syntrophomonas sp.]